MERPPSVADKVVIASTKCLLITACGLAISEHKQCQVSVLQKKMEEDYFVCLARNEYDLSSRLLHICKYSTFTCKSILIGRTLWDKYKEALHCFRNILMPAFKSVVNDSGTNLEDALNQVCWAHWAYKTNKQAKKKYRKGGSADVDIDIHMDDPLKTVTVAEECNTKDT